MDGVRHLLWPVPFQSMVPRKMQQELCSHLRTSADCCSPVISTEVHRYKLPDLCDFSKLKSKQELFILPVTEFIRHFCSYNQDCKSFVYCKCEKDCVSVPLLGKRQRQCGAGDKCVLWNRTASADSSVAVSTRFYNKCLG